MLFNQFVANKQVATKYGQITFNEKGESRDLNTTEQKDLGKLPGFKYVEEKKQAPKTEDEEPKKETSTTSKSQKNTRTASKKSESEEK